MSVDDISEYEILVLKNIYEPRFVRKFVETDVRIVSMYKWKLFRLFYLLKYFRSRRDSVVVDFRGDLGGLTMLAAKFAGIQARLIFYRESRYQFKRTLARDLYVRGLHWLVYKLSTKILSNAYHSLEYFFTENELRNIKYKVIPNGVFNQTSSLQRNNRESGKISDKVVIGHIGRAVSVKNHELIVDVLKGLLNKHYNVELILVGESVEELIDSMNLDESVVDKITCYDYVQNVAEVILRMDIFLFPSFNEGQPNALIEAMGSGVFCIASDIDAHHEININSTIPLLNPNDVDSWCSLISKVITEGYSYNTIDFAKEVKKFFDMEKCFNEFKKELL